MLDGKIAWVVGGGSGIGKAGALALAAAGAFVVVSGRRSEKLQETCDEIINAGGKADSRLLDVTDAAAVQAVCDEIASRHGRLDIVVNSAGMNVPLRYWDNLTPESFKTVVDTNLNGSLNTVHAALPYMRDRRDGLFIHVASWAGRYDPYVTGPAYNASKHAILALSYSLNYTECTNGIRSSVICPGEVATEIITKRAVPPSPEDLARMLQSKDLGDTIRFVAEAPSHVCVNEILISPTWNRIFFGGPGMEPKRVQPA